MKTMRKQIIGLVFCVASFAMNAVAQTNTFPSSGSVGIGTTTPAAKLQVIGAALIGENTNGTAVIDAYNGDAYFGDNTATNGIAVNANGNVGIGMAGPDSKLEFYGNSDQTTTALTDAGSRQSNLSLIAGDDSYGAGAAIAFGNAQSLGAGTIGWAAIKAFLTNGSGNTYGDLAFSTRNSTSDTALTERVRILGSGNVGIGTTTPGAPLEVNGNVKLTANSGASITFQDGTTQSTAFTGVVCGGDYAESVDVTGDRTTYAPGDVLVLDSDNPGKILKSAESYSTSVAGIYSTKPGTVGRRQLTPKSDSEVPMAMIGVVPTKVTDENGSIKVGDLLVSSSHMGYAMKGTDRNRMLGAVIGKAMGTLKSGNGVIEVLVALQ